MPTKTPTIKTSWYEMNRPVITYYKNVVVTLLYILLPAALGAYMVNKYPKDIVMFSFGYLFITLGAFCLLNAVMRAESE